MANLTVQLLNNWAVYEQEHPNATLKDFYLSQLQQPELEKAAAGAIHLCLQGRQAELTIKQTLKTSPLSSVNELLLLYSATQTTPSQKGKVIRAAGMEITTGTDVCARLIDRGLLTEHPDYSGGNIKLLRLTPRGGKVLKGALIALGQTL